MVQLDAQLSAREVLRVFHRDEPVLFLGAAFTTVGLMTEAFCLVRLQGLLQEEAAEVLGVSISTVQRRLYRAVSTLAKELDHLRPPLRGEARHVRRSARG